MIRETTMHVAELLGILLVALVLLVVWARWLQRLLPGSRLLRATPWALGAAWLAAAATSGWALRAAQDLSGDPARKAELLVERLALAMNSAAALLLPVAAAMVGLGIATWRARKE